MVSYKNTIKLLLKKMESGPQNDQIILAIGKLKGALVRLQTKEKDNG